MPSKEVYHGYIKLGICPSCRQNMLFGDERSCPECKALDINEGWLLGYDVEMEKKVFNKAEGSKDAELLYKISLLNERDKTVIISMINSMLENKVGN